MKMSLNVRKARGVARRTLACITSAVLVVGLMPSVALADDDQYKCVIGSQTDPLYVPYNQAGYIYYDVEVDGNIAVKSDTTTYALNANAVENEGPAIILF